MDILIKNMEMPKKGETRYLFIDGDGYVGIWNEGNKGFVYSHEAISVPEHGDLIDRDELLASDAIDWGEEAWNGIRDAPTVLERTT